MLRKLRHLPVFPADPKSQRFVREIDAYCEAIQSSREPKRTIESDLESTIVEFSKWQNEALDRMMSEFEESLRNLTDTLDEAIASGDEIAETARSASRTIRHADPRLDSKQWRELVVAEAARLAAIVHEHSRVMEALHERYVTEVDVLRGQIENAQRNTRIDPVTQLPNAIACGRYLEAACERASAGAPIAVALVELDVFRSINAELGHDAGDCALYLFGCSIKEALDPTAFVGRLGSCRFLIVQLGKCAEIESDLEKWSAQLSKRSYAIEGDRRALAATVGMVLATKGQTKESILLAAETQLQSARNTARIFDAA